MGWTILYLFVFLKLPIVGAGWLIWWAVHQEVDEAPTPGGEGGSPHLPHPHRRRPRPRLPRTPRRGGPHAGGAPLHSPARVRSVTAAGRARELHHHR